MARNKYPEVTIERIIETAKTLFVEKGYENTTIQDIIDALGNLSKGAIYHHFKSKEDILLGVAKSMTVDIDSLYKQISQAATEDCGLAKLKAMLSLTIEVPYEKLQLSMLPNLMKNSKFLTIFLKETVVTAPRLIERIVNEGIADGSITCDHPKELSQTLALFINLWFNPFIFECSADELVSRYKFFLYMMRSINIDLLDDELLVRIHKWSNIIANENMITLK